MSTPTEYLNERVTVLERDKAQLQAALKQARGERKQAGAELDGLKAQLQQLTAERDSFKVRAESGPAELTQRIAQLEGEIRTRDFRAEFTKAALAAGAKPEAIDDLYTLSGLTPPADGSEITPEVFAEPLKAAQTGRSWAFSGAAQPAGQTGTAQGTAAVPPPGAGRGASSPSVSGVRYSADDVRKPGWQQARPELVEALQKGTAVFVE